MFLWFLPEVLQLQLLNFCVYNPFRFDFFVDVRVKLLSLFLLLFCFCFHIQTSNCSSPIYLKSNRSPLNLLCTFVKIQLIIRVYFWSFYSVPLFNKTILLPLSHFLDYYDFMLRLKSGSVSHQLCSYLSNVCAKV